MICNIWCKMSGKLPTLLHISVFQTIHTSRPQSLVHASQIKIMLREIRWKRQMVGEYPEKVVETLEECCVPYIAHWGGKAQCAFASFNSRFVEMPSTGRCSSLKQFLSLCAMDIILWTWASSLALLFSILCTVQTSSYQNVVCGGSLF